VVGRLYEPAVPDAFRRENLWTEPMSILARAGHPIFVFGIIDAEAFRPFDFVLPTIPRRVGQEIERLMMVGDLLRGALRLAPLAAPGRPASLIQRRDAKLSPPAALFVEVLRG
jgi:LysR family pca operon transcriptional activator